MAAQVRASGTGEDPREFSTTSQQISAFVLENKKALILSGTHNSTLGDLKVYLYTHTHEQQMWCDHVAHTSGGVRSADLFLLAGFASLTPHQ